MSFHDRNYIIFNTSEVSSINFSEVLETSSETLRLSVNESKTFVKYDGETMPSSISSLTSKQGPYTHSEILTILSGSEWTNDDGILGP